MKFIFPFIMFFGFFSANAQQEDIDYMKSIFDHSLTHSSAYPWLESLTQKVGNRLSGTPQAAKAVKLTKEMLDNLDLDNVWLQPCMVPHWERGIPEQVYILGRKKTLLTSLALGNSIGTGKKGLTAEVIEVLSLKEVEELGKKKYRR